MSQMSLFDEWESHPDTSRSLNVHQGYGVGVNEEWLSFCAEQRALTSKVLDELCELSNLTSAYRQVVSNGGSPGVDGMSVKDLRVWFKTHHQSLRLDLLRGTYRPKPVRQVSIPKAGGGERVLGIPTVIDRLVHQAISQVLTRYYDPTFSPFSYGFRRGRSPHEALAQAGAYVKSGHRWIVDIDLAKFFDTVLHGRLMWLLGTRIGDHRLLGLISRILGSGVLSNGLSEMGMQGMPQGSPLSPLLSNIVLDELDKELDRRGHRYVRYADDMIILVKSRQAAHRVMSSVSRYIEDKLKLRVNAGKSGIRRPHALNFLGHSLLGNGELGLSKESERRFKRAIRTCTRRNRGISLEQLIKELNTKLRGWLSYFKRAKMVSKLRGLESWLRHRIRCFRLKQCKRALGIARFLQRQGVPKKRAWLLAVSGKGWYRMALSPGAHEGMNLAWFNRIGLFSLTAHYVKP